ncbi:MAG: tRNA preQ1(34) S-adenosylmethionine ribosyltransferase-isomerase QueA [Proteobacteria bacterium]|nr:tRNA preQ1(34) S-adenosylmethionine ribosyltransferase-isomerase QueA [Pseudomonadota bacterium]
MTPYRVSDFDYALPPELIAQAPPASRGASRLLDVVGDRLVDRRFDELPQQVEAGDVVVFNDTRVIKARFHARKATGGRVEGLVERVVGPDAAWAQIRASHTPKVGAVLQLDGGGEARIEARDEQMVLLRFALPVPLDDWLDAHGDVPLPPYITRPPDAADLARYQTVYARVPGAVAAPTAGLHFDDALLAALAARGATLAYLTLHVGAGTFQPVRHDDVSQHRMHRERFSIPGPTRAAIAAARARNGRVIAVGTTTLRALEAAHDGSGNVVVGDADTALFITPGYRFGVVDRLVTNFHLPRSTLLMLVSAFAGYDRIRAAYAHAVAARYRFFSYGDAMLLRRLEG